MKYKHIEGTGKPLKVVAPKGCLDYVTEGKEYTVLSYVPPRDEHRGYLFRIHPELSITVLAKEKKCEHLNGGNWIVTEREQ